MVRAAREYEYSQIDLNCGCPSTETDAPFGAALMRNPTLVASIVDQMAAAAKYEVPISVKCRIGIHESYKAYTSEDRYEVFSAFVAAVTKAGAVCDVIVHARSAVLQGLSPSKNREIPPLRWDFVTRLAADNPHLRVVLNGGVKEPSSLVGVDTSRLAGVMVGRAALQRPLQLGNLWESEGASSVSEVIERYFEYAFTEIQRSPRDEHASIVMPLAILAYSFERALEHSGTHGGGGLLYLSGPSCDETGWLLADRLNSLMALSHNDIGFSQTSERNREDAPPLKKMRKHLADVFGKKLYSKMKATCNEE